MFKKILLHQWRQFGDLEIDFDPRLTVLTGQNGTGKTTILKILSQHFGWQAHLVGTPKYLNGNLTFRADVRRDFLQGENEEYVPSVSVGRLEYSQGEGSDIRVQTRTGDEYQPELPQRKEVVGLFVSSHRPLYQFQRISTIPTVVVQASGMYNTVLSEAANRFRPGHNFQSPSFRLKETLVSWAVFGPGSEILSPNPVALEAFRGFEDLLRQVLPADIGFHSLRIEMPEVVLQTDSGDFPLEGASGGVGAIIDLVWQVYLFVLANPNRDFALLIDEPENHLHPSLQRELMPKLLGAFPRSQIIVSTHSPFVVSADPSARVYSLRFDESNRVSAQLLDTLDKSGSANEVLRTGLGLEVTMPVWVEGKLSSIAQRFESVDAIDSDTIDELRRELRDAGLEDYTPDALTRMLQSRRDVS
ncbi:AAA family ATPase [Dactylosporangium sp. NPDC006015]|uniref:AAA family ATPase n=1 Tax=Dactylosporangium sp. NPDC006015 TaxID=3154576 RepID=UPI0033BD0135